MKVLPPFDFSNDDVLNETNARQPVVLSTRIRLARNIAKFPFPWHAKPAQKREVLHLCLSALSEIPLFKDTRPRLMGTLDINEKALLVERHLISKELAESEESAVLISPDQTCSVMINEEDHLRIQVLRDGSSLCGAWKQASQIDTEIETHIEPAFSRNLGYYTSCPSNLGTGMRASLMLHLPGLVLCGHMEKIIRALDGNRLTVRGWLGEGSDAVGSIFQISNQHTLGSSEEDILHDFSAWLKHLIQQEENARLCLIEADPDKFFDQIARAISVLRNSRLLSSAEAMGVLSHARLACDLGMFPSETRACIDELLIKCQPTHVQASASKQLNPRERDTLRAQMFRETFSTLPLPNFDILSSKRRKTREKNKTDKA
ncbi:MAG: ATP--guanido phosphotransferase [Puniceicoccales bacterium]|jgi:protein arginine kinase|nr:ATP--guanido phosphotransferase [Puniceicoccales bacterium]